MNAESPRKFTPAAFILPLVVILGAIAGCGDEPSRNAGTIDMPERSTAKPDLKQAAADAKARAKEAKAAKAASPNR
ncbi:hypothetical protein [Aquisphaera insulae]|uniref:hypothetical protein n=1 Tax=Aquisphaera insulae TaxID=2712864 RepID=UPI0013EBDACD|nr:hypothetical protein [Aquisphaera insulae]